jgi:hypothetical protein
MIFGWGFGRVAKTREILPTVSRSAPEVEFPAKVQALFARRKAIVADGPAAVFIRNDPDSAPGSIATIRLSEQDPRRVIVIDDRDLSDELVQDAQGVEKNVRTWFGDGPATAQMFPDGRVLIQSAGLFSESSYIPRPRTGKLAATKKLRRLAKARPAQTLSGIGSGKLVVGPATYGR